MGLTLRIFLVDNDDSIQRLALARYERLLRPDPDECLPQYAGKRVRYALVVVDLAKRKPLEIQRIQYSMLSFDSIGRIDRAEQEKEARLAMQVQPPLTIYGDSRQVIEARHRFAKKRYDNEYKWEPTPEIEAAIIDAVFGRT